MDLPAHFWNAVAGSVIAHGAVLGYLETRPADVLPHGSARPPTFITRIVAPAAAQPSPTAIAGAGPAVDEPKKEQPPPPAASEPAAVAAPAPAPVAEAPYLPRGQLTVAPRLLDVVDVPFPEDVKGIVDLKVRITLFIDEDGKVQRIRVDDPAQIHPAFERAIRDTFGNAHFAPGELHEAKVRSQMRMEVMFEAPGGRRS